jgi:hypothetical protein
VSARNRRQPWQRMRRAEPAAAQAAALQAHHPHGQLWTNNRYTVIAEPIGGGWMHLSIRRNDRAPARDWRDLQRIKNDIYGPEAEGVELFPAESRLVDLANQLHLWVLVTGERLPIGFHDGRVVATTAQAAAFGARQRDLADEDEDAAATSPSLADRPAIRSSPTRGATLSLEAQHERR